MPSSPGASGAVFEWGGLLASEAVEVSVRRRRQPGFHQRPALGERIGAGSPPVCGDRLSPPLGRAVIAMPRGRERGEVFRLCRGRGRTRLVVRKRQQFLLHLADRL